MTAPAPSPPSDSPQGGASVETKRRKRVWAFLLLDAAALLLPVIVHSVILFTGLPHKLISYYEAQTGVCGPQSYTLVGPWGTWIAGGTLAGVLLICALRLWESRRLFWLPAIPILASLWWFHMTKSLFLFG